MPPAQKTIAIDSALWQLRSCILYNFRDSSLPGVSPLHTSLTGKPHHSSIPTADPSVFFYVYEPCIAFCAPVLCFGDLRDWPSVLLFSSSNEAFQLSWGMWEGFSKPTICAHLITYKFIFHWEHMWDCFQLCIDGNYELVLPMLSYLRHVHVATLACSWAWVNMSCHWKRAFALT